MVSISRRGALYGYIMRARRPSAFRFPERIVQLTVTLLTILAIAVPALALVYLLVCYLMASGMTRVGEAEFQDCPSDYGAEFESVRFGSRRGDVTLDGWWMRGREGMPSVVLCHGIEIGRTGDGLTELAADLNRRGFGVLQFDFRGHGLSEGKRVSSGWHERMDTLGAYDYLISRGVAPGQVGLLGISMGAGASSLAAAEESGIRALVLDSPYASAAEMIMREIRFRTGLPKWFSAIFVVGAVALGYFLFDIKVDDMRPERAVSKLDYPVLVIHGTEDARIPPEHGRRVFEAAAEGSRLWLVEGAEHAESFVLNKAEYADRVADYFLSRLRRE